MSLAVERHKATELTHTGSQIREDTFTLMAT